MLRIISSVLMLLLCWGGTSAHPGTINPNITGHIIGGVTVSIVDYPYQVSMRNNGEHICGGSIISNYWILTAAHCATDTPLATTTFKVGSTDRKIGGTILTPVTRVVHASYNSITADFDIAVYKMQQPIIFTDKVGTIALTATNPATGTFTIVSGWGLTSTNPPVVPDILMAVSVPTVSTASCQTSWPNKVITPRMLCAGFTVGTKNACMGDSGGPLIVNVNNVKIQVGIVSWGNPNCGAANSPGVYTSVANLRAWIKTETGV